MDEGFSVCLRQAASPFGVLGQRGGMTGGQEEHMTCQRRPLQSMTRLTHTLEQPVQVSD